MATKSQMLVNMQFTADTSKAQAQLKELQNSLTQLTKTTPNSKLGIEEDINDAVRAAARLKVELENATNVKTGKLDLGKLTESLDIEKLKKYKEQLESLGPQGQKAFKQFANAIANAEIPLRRSNTLIKEFWTTLSNTAKWKLTSSALDSFTGAIQTAYYYAQDLNKSLNDIRIVTGYSSDQMANFAAEANKAAKALSTTTTEYTDASLIYFQQGLSDEEVKKRTDVTVKMANVTGESAQAVSDYMTAIWNNFDDGSKSLEYYADVMTTLGAATASSTDEIAAGLEKFAAVADTIGLSYEYATSALATITAETRQNADVVGNALKTLFSRIQGLKLGETLDDGTDLNKYSKALDAVGVSIKDTSGQVKDMDTILDELGSRWKTLAKDEQLAVAQTVAGVRQYTQLVALMDNWDIFKQNVSMASGSSGTLNQQAEIYAESWEAARDRVQTALENIYQKLIKDDAFITMLNGVEKVIDGISNLIDGLGGLEGVLATIGTIATKVFRNQIKESISNVAYNIKTLTGKNAEEGRNLKIGSQEMAKTMAIDSGTNEGSVMAENLNIESNVQIAMIENANKLTEKEQQLNVLYLDRIKYLNEIREASARTADNYLREMDSIENNIYKNQQGKSAKDINDEIDKFQKLNNATEILLQKISKKDKNGLVEMLKDSSKAIKVFTTAQQDAVDVDIGKFFEDQNIDIKKYVNNLEKATEETEEYNALLELKGAILQGQSANEAQLMKNLNIDADTASKIASLGYSYDEISRKAQEAGVSVKEFADNVIKGIQNPNAIKMTWIDKLQLGGEVALNTISIMKSFDGIFDVLSNPDLSGWEKFISVISTLSFTLPQTLSTLQQLKQTLSANEVGFDLFFKAISKASIQSNIFQEIQGILINELKDIKDNYKLVTKEITQEIISKTMSVLITEKDIKKRKEKIVQLLLETLKTKDNTNAIKKETAEKIASELATKGLSVAAKGLATTLGVVTIAITAVIAIYALWKKRQEEIIEQKKELAEQSQKEVEEIRELNEQNSSLIEEMSSALKLYKENTDSKVELDNITQKLAEAYHIEGSALAELTGKVEDYNIVLQEAIEKRKNAWKQQINQEAINAGYQADILRSQLKGYVYGPTKKDQEASSILDEFLNNRTITDLTDYHSIIEYYDALEMAAQSMRENGLESTKIYEHTLEQINSLKEGIELLKDSAAQVDIYNIFYGQGQEEKIALDSIDNLKEYSKWIKNAEAELIRLGYTSSEVEILLTTISNNALNPKISELKDFKEAIDEILSDFTGKGIDEKLLIDLFSSEKYDASTLAAINWSSVTADSYEKVLNKLQSYNNLLKDQASLEEQINAINSAAEIISSKGEEDYYTQEDIDTLQNSGITWGENGIIDLSSFLRMSFKEGDLLLQQLLIDSKNALIQTNNEALLSLKEQYETNKKILENTKIGISDNEIAKAKEQINALEKMKEVLSNIPNFGEVIASPEELDETKEKVLEVFHDLEEVFAETNIDLSSMGFTEDNISTWIENGIDPQRINTTLQNIFENIPQEILAYINAEDTIGKLQDDINELETTIEIEGIIEYNESLKGFENFIDEVRDATDDIENVFSAIADGATYMADEAGNAFWSFSTEAIEAVSKIYPEFMRNAKLMADGTWRVTEEMYQAVFDAENGILAANTEATAQKLGNLANEAYARADYYGRMAEMAYELANADIETQRQSEDIKTELRNANNESTAEAINEKIGFFNKSMTEEIDAENQIGMAVDNTNTFIGESSNTAFGTAAANSRSSATSIIDDFNAIGAAAAAAFNAAITGEHTPVETPSTSYAGSSGNIVHYKHSSNEELEANLASQLGFEGDGDYTSEEYKKMYTAMGNSFSKLKDMFYSLGNSLKGAAADTFGSVDKVSDNLQSSKDNFEKEKAKEAEKNKQQTKQEAETVEALDQEIERYHTIKTQLDDIEWQLDRLAGAKERAFGKSKLALIDEESKALEKQIELQEQYLKELEKNFTTDQAYMHAYGAEFDENGAITNYETIHRDLIDGYNKNYAGTTNVAEAAGAEAIVDMFNDTLTQYEETVDEWQEAYAQKAELQRQLYNKLFEGLTYEIEFKLEIQEDDLTVLEYYMNKIEDDAYSAAEAIALMGNQTEVNLNKTAIYNQGISDLFALHGLDETAMQEYLNGTRQLEELITVGFSDEDISQLREYRDGLIEVNESLMEIRDTMYEKVLETFEAWNSEMDDSINKLESLTGVLENYQNIVEIVGTETLGLDDEFMNKMSQSIINNSKNVLTANKEKYEALLSSQHNAQKAYEEAVLKGNEESIKHWEKTLKEIDSQVVEAQDNMLSSWNDALEAAADMFEVQVDRVVSNFEKSMSGSFGNLDALQEAFEQQSEINDRYLDDYQKIYELSKLNRNIANSINETDNIKAKGMLRDLQEEINILQAEETQMSQYDLEYLQKRYELRLAEIALEEAQNAKSMVRLTRDSEGNFSYVYTADQNRVSSAQQEYEDALFALQTLNEEYIQSLQELAIESQLALAEAIRNIDRTQFRTEEEYMQRVKQVQEYYLTQQEYYYAEMEKALGNNTTIYENEWTKYSEMTGYKISDDEKYITNFNETILSQISGYQTLDEYQQAFVQSTNQMVLDLQIAYENWEMNLEEIMQAAGTSIEDFDISVEESFKDVEDASNNLIEEIENDANDMKESFDDIIDKVQEWEEQYGDSVDEVIVANEEMINSSNDMIDALSNVDMAIDQTTSNFTSSAAEIEAAAASIAAAAEAAYQAALKALAAKNAVNNSSESPSTNGGKPSSNGGSAKDDNNDKKTNSKDKGGTGQRFKFYIKNQNGRIVYTADGFNTEQDAISKAKKQVALLEDTIPIWDKGKNIWYKYYIDSYDTGGYTGSWSSTDTKNGRLAILHEKELVLNKEDTANMLSAVNMVRKITDQIDLQAMSNMNSNISVNNSVNSLLNSSNTPLEQMVTIKAEFPSVTQHSEIEEAFNNLINRASQYANRKW